MSEFREALDYIVADREVGTQELCRDLVSGRTFMAEYEEVTPFDMETDLGNDPRESSKLYIRDRGIVALLLGQGQVEVFLFSQWHTFTIVRRDNNPGSPQATFTLKYNVPGRDS